MFVVVRGFLLFVHLNPAFLELVASEKSKKNDAVQHRFHAFPSVRLEVRETQGNNVMKLLAKVFIFRTFLA